jgi:hypothetical protein
MRLVRMERRLEPIRKPNKPEASALPADDFRIGSKFGPCPDTIPSASNFALCSARGLAVQAAKGSGVIRLGGSRLSARLSCLYRFRSRLNVPAS